MCIKKITKSEISKDLFLDSHVHSYLYGMDKEYIRQPSARLAMHEYNFEHNSCQINVSIIEL